MRNNKLKFIMAALLIGGTALSLATKKQASLDREQALEPDVVTYDNDAVYDRDDLVFDDEEEVVSPTKVILHYTADTSVESLRFYLWNEVEDGVEYMYDSLSTDGKTMTITLDFINDSRFTSYANLRGMYFIIKTAGIWVGQSEDTYLDYALFPPDAGTTEVWCIPGEGNAIEIYATEAETQMDKILAAQFTNWKSLRIRSTIAPASWELYAYTPSYLKADSFVQSRTKSDYLIRSGINPSTKTATEGGVEFTVNLNHTIHPNVRYVVEAKFPTNPTKTMTKNAGFETLYNTERFTKYYTYTGNDLGVTIGDKTTTFRVWAPTATRMDVLLYMNGTPASIKDFDGKKGSDSKTNVMMAYKAGGIWEATLNFSAVGMYYNYFIYGPGGNFEVTDPYAKACGVNGARGAIINFDDTNPENWDNVPLKWDGKAGYDIKSRNELSVYEVHVQDLTSDKTWVTNHGNRRGTYSAFSEAGTTYSKQSVTVKTGFDHIEEMGVKAVQLMPMYDHDNNEFEGHDYDTEVSPEEESEWKDNYNWGYNPLNYNCIEGAYATDPFHAEARVKEFKELVQAYANNANKTRVIMDVVYNHVSSAPGSCFNKLMPRYYFRYTSNWSYYNGSGCGNEVKSEAPMMRKYIIESLCWWATEYKVKGFRFDLMGLIDCETLKQAAAELYKIDPDIVMYGEGWRGDGDGFHGEGKPADTANVYSELYGDGTRVPVGGFNDEGRNALRGGNDQGWGSSSHLPGWGYMQRGDDASAEQANAVSMMILGIHEGKGGNPEQCINYASCHDNWTLFDQLYYTLGDSGKGVAPSMERVVQATAAAQSLIMLTNGVAFMQGGEEIFRSKRLNDTDKAKVESSTYEAMYSYTVSHNSYNAPASVNSFKWDRKIVADGVETKDYCAKIAEAVKLHSTMQKWTYPNVPTAGKTSSLGKLIENTYWAGKDKDNNTYYGSGGFQLDEYFIFLSGRCWSYTSFGDVAKCGGDPIFAVGNYSYDSTNKTVNLGYLDTRNWGGALVIFKRLSI